MRDSDLPFAAALYTSSRAAELASTGWPEAERAAFLAQQQRAQHHHYRSHYSGALWLILEQWGAPIGRLYLAEWAREFRVVDILLTEDARRSGIGGAVLADVLEFASSLGKGVSIHVEKENPARRLYQRLGFRVMADKGVYDLMEWRIASNGLQKKSAS